MRIVRFILTLLFLAPAIAAIALVALMIVKQFASAAVEAKQGTFWSQDSGAARYVAQR